MRRRWEEVVALGVLGLSSAVKMLKLKKYQSSVLPTLSAPDLSSLALDPLWPQY